MKFKQIIIALVILAALGGAYYFVQKQPAAADPNAVAREDVFSFKPEDVQEFSLVVSGQPSATFRRAASAAPAPKADDKNAAPPASKWEIVEPAGIAADSEQINSFLDEFAGFKANPLSNDAAAQAPVWADYGLDQPVRTIKFKLKDGKSITLDVGKENPAGFAKYARRNEAPPVLLLDTGDNKSLLEKTLFDLRDKRILPKDINAANRIDLHFNFANGGPSAAEVAKAKSLGLPVRPERISFIRDTTGNWKLIDPVRRTDIGGATYLATIIGGGQMHSVVEEKAGSNLAQYGLDKPQIRVEITSPSGSGGGTVKDELLVGKMVKEGEQEFFYAMTNLRPHVFTILRTVYDQVNQDLEYYRNRYLFDFELGQPSSLELS